MNDMARRDATVEAAQPRVNGVVDVLRSNRIAGWAIDRADASATVRVEILREGRPWRSVMADRHRPDLEKGGIGTGRYGFGVEIDPPVEPGLEFTVQAIAFTADGQSAPLKPVGSAEQAVPPELRLLVRLMASVEDLKSGLQLPEAPNDALIEIAQRLELAQARLEAAITAIEARPGLEQKARMPAVVFAAIGLGVLSLAVGVMSFW